MKTFEYHPSSSIWTAVIVSIMWFGAMYVKDYLDDRKYKEETRAKIIEMIEKTLKTQVCIREKIDSYTVSQGAYGPVVATKCK